MLFIGKMFSIRRRTLLLSLSAHDPNHLFGRLFSSITMNTARQPSAQPRLSASLIVVNQRNEVLLVHRNPDASNFGGMHVFPGGNLDETQDESLEMTAIRETYEESGLLLASTRDPSTRFPSNFTLDEARHAIHEQKMNFRTFLQTHGLRPDDSLLPFTQWVTPAGFPRRFKTQFYLTFLTSGSSFSSSLKQESWLPSHDGSREVIEAQFLQPKTVLEACHTGDINCMPPQFYLLSTLADVFSGLIGTADQRRQLENLSSGAFGKMIITPTKLGRDEDNNLVLALNGDETYGGPVGHRHRMLGKIVENGTFAASGLVRNFDIMNEMESKHTAKL